MRKNHMTKDKKYLNIAIDKDLHRQMKISATQEGETIIQFVSESIKERIEKLQKTDK